MLVLRLITRLAPSLLAAFAFLLSGCRVHVEPLMPSPVLYTDGRMDPFPFLEDRERRPTVDILYATNRARGDDWQVIQYNNSLTDRVSLGAAAVRLGGPGMTWENLLAASTSSTRDAPLPIEMAGTFERGGFPVAEPLGDPGTDSQEFIDAINRRVDTSFTGDIFIFVHGAKVNFYNACAFTGQLSHFIGRDMVGVAFAWPTQQNIVAYGLGKDVGHAYESGDALASLIEFLAARTHARRINILSWSAGARVVCDAVATLCERHPDSTADSLRSKLRLGTVYFAAGDAPLAEFLERIDDLHAMSDRVVVSLSDADGSLSMAGKFMGGGRRIGQHGTPLVQAQRDHLNALERLEVVDVSYGQEARGFDIGGHRYWFNHPWCSTDTLLVLRTGLPASERGLVQVDGWRCVWALPADYPERVRTTVERMRAKRDASVRTGQ